MPHIVNMAQADLRTAVAGADHSQLGMVCKVTNSSGARALTPLTDTDDALVVAGNYAVAMKYSSNAWAVDTTSADTTALGDRRTAIKSGDVILECRRGTILEYDLTELGASLQSTPPAVGDALGIASGLWATTAAATTSGIATPVVGRVHQVLGSKYQIELL